jgi:hypothetical protein
MEKVTLSPALPAPRDPEVARAGQAFEALVIERMLKGARVEAMAGALSGGGEWVELADRHRAEAVAKGAPLGVAKLIAEAAARERCPENVDE